MARPFLPPHGGVVQPCAINGCGRPARTRGLCKAHYSRLLRLGDPLAGGGFNQPVPPRCTVEGCTKPAHARQVCIAHYSRLYRHGDPLAGGPPCAPQGAGSAFIEQALQYVSDDCLIWPYGRNRGYGSVHDGERARGAHCIVCERAHGPAPNSRLMAAHSCGQPLSVVSLALELRSPRRLLPCKTISRAFPALVVHRKCRGFTHSVRDIRRSPLSSSVLGRLYGVTRGTISAVRSGKNWAWLD
jgi:hypothetical protein